MRGPCACPLRRPTRSLRQKWRPVLARGTSTRPPPLPSSTPCPYRLPFPILFVTIHHCAPTTGSAVRLSLNKLIGRDRDFSHCTLHASTNDHLVLLLAYNDAG